MCTLIKRFIILAEFSSKLKAFLCLPNFVYSCKCFFPTTESVLATPSSILQKKPLLNHVYLVLQGKSSNWDAIGRGFNVPLNTREALRKDTSLSDDSRLERVMNTWLETSCHTPVTWTELVNVLTVTLGFMDVTEKVHSLLEREHILKEYSN